MATKLAVEFVMFVLKKEPADASFLHLYDAMSRAATLRAFHNMGHKELAQVGISFSLLNTGDLENLIKEARETLSSSSQSKPPASKGQA